MAALNRNAVKLALPALFEAMADPKWQTKQVATNLLGHLADASPEQISVSLRPLPCTGWGRRRGAVHAAPACSAPPPAFPGPRALPAPSPTRAFPRLLAPPLTPAAATPPCPQVYLPEIVPVVTNCMVDLKPTVREAATAALTKCCAAIGNRDIEPFVPHLIRCIGAPGEVPDCVHKLSATTFVQVRREGAGEGSCVLGCRLPPPRACLAAPCAPAALPPCPARSLPCPPCPPLLPPAPLPRPRSLWTRAPCPSWCPCWSAA